MGVRQIRVGSDTFSIPVNLGRSNVPPHGKVYVHNMCGKERTRVFAPP